ncbi:MAG: aldo/keto reductase, partial [Clostridia bacterium]|nr:aldo/keto reductase [Clostridia bacterium]
MYNIKLGKSELIVPTVAIGCMRIAEMNDKKISEFIDTALSYGANFFDHADIYGRGKCEEVFGKAIKTLDREDIIIQTKCGIVPGKMFDFSYEHIINSVDKSLQR